MKQRKRTSGPAHAHLVALLGRVARGDGRAFEQLHLLTRNKLRKTVLSICPGSETEDILQEAYLRIWRGASSFDAGLASPMTWMCTVARNVALDAVRLKRLPIADLDEALAVAAPTEDTDDFDYVLARQVSAEVIKSLPEDRRRLLSLAYSEGMSRQSLAQHFGVPVGTVKTWLRRTIIALQADCLAAAGRPVVTSMAG